MAEVVRYDGDAQVLVQEVEQTVHVVHLHVHAPPYARPGERGVGGLARPPVGVKVHEHLAAQLVRRDGRAGPGEAVRGMAQHRHRLAAQRHRAQLVGVLLRTHREGQVKPPRRDLLRQRAGAGLPQTDLHVRVPAPERGEQPRHVHPGDTLLGAEREHPAQHALHRGHRLVGRPHLREDPLRLAQQRPPGRGERHPAGGPHEQRRPQLPFQRADRGGQARLGHHQPLGRPGEVLVLGDRDEVLKMAQFHD
ncbi:hypothetical protein GCM10010254_56410 [Streptomyces chromofuscus]|nr:hypothetical protein GCM10010254_56410 [Streptomyces chromofuscus]